MLPIKESKRDFSSKAMRASEKAERTAWWPSATERTHNAASTSATRALSLFELVKSVYVT